MPDKKVVVLFDSKVDRLDGIYLVAEELGFKPIMLITNEFDHKHESVPERVKRYKTFKS